MSSEALERAARIRENISHVARGCRSASSHNPAPYLNSIEAALVALLAEVDRLEQERDAYRDRESEVNIERQRNEVRAELAEAALAVGREREQRAEKVHKAASDFVAMTTVFRLRKESRDEFVRLAVALVDEPAAATRQPHQALGRCRCGACHTLDEAIELNYAAATLAEPREAGEGDTRGSTSPVGPLGDGRGLRERRSRRTGRDAMRRLTVTTSDSYLYDPARVRALYEQLLPDPDLYGDEPVYAVFAYLKNSMYGADVFEAQGDWGEWVEKDEEYDPDA